MRVVLAEDQFLLRDGISTLLRAQGFEIVAAVTSGPELALALVVVSPVFVVVDVRLPPTYTDEGLKVALEARRRTPGLPVLVLSQHVERVYARELLTDAAGAVGYLLKDRVLDGAQFVNTVRQVAAGATMMDPEVVTKLLGSTSRTPAVASLTPREHEVLSLMAQGRSNAAIAERLRISEGSVSKHSASIFGKLGLPQSDASSRRVLAVLAYLGDAGATGG